MKKRKILSIFLALALMTGIVPAKAAELPAPEGLTVTWYTDYEGLMRRYGTDRMLLVKDGKSGLFGLDGTKYTDCIFDAFGEFSGSGLAPACLNGKWGMVDLDGKTVVDFIYDGQYEAEVQAATYPVFKGKGGKNAPPYALFAPDGTQLTGYDFWAYKPFVNRFARVTNGELYAYIGADGQLITPYIYTDESKDFGTDGYAVVHEYSIGYNLINVRGEKLLPQGYTSFNRHPWDAGFGIWGYLDADGIVFVDLATGKRINERAFVNAFDMGKSWPSGYEFNDDGIMSVVLHEDGEQRYYLMDTTGSLTAVERDNGTGLPIDPATGETYLPSSGPRSSQETDGWYEGLKWVNYKGESAYAGDRDGPWGFMDKSGTMVVPAVFDAVGYFDHGVAVVKSGDTFGLLKNPLTTPAQTPAEEDPFAGLDVAWLDTENQLSPEGYDNLIREFHIIDYRSGRGGPFPYGDYGLRNAHGQEVAPALYGTTLPGGPDYGAFVVKEETLADGTVQQTDFLGRTAVKKDRPDWDPAVPSAYKEPSPDGHDKWGFNNPWTGEIVLPAIYDAADDFSEGIAVVEKDGRKFAINEQGQELFDLSQYIFVGRFSEGRAWVRRVDPFGEGFIDANGKELIPAQWDTGDGEEFREGYAIVRSLGTDLFGVVDRDGNFLIPVILDGATQFESGVAVITYQGRQGILKNPDLRDKTSDWAAEEVAAAARAGYVTPSCETYQTFSITRAQFAELAVNYVEKKTGKAIDPAPADTFTDTDDETILKAYAAGIVQGMGNGTFSPGGLLTREQLAAMLWRAMEKVGVTAVPAELGSYTDNDKVSDWARDSVAALAGLKVMAGTSETTLSPKDSCTVEQAILLVSRAAD